MITEWIISILVLAGSLFVFIASLGIYRLPDFYMRMHAATKATSLGLFLILVGYILFFTDLTVILKALAIIIFLFLTTPVAAHMLARVALHMNVPLWSPDEPKKPDDPGSKEK